MEEKIICEEITSHHATTTLSSVRKALKRLTQLRDMEYHFFDVNGFDANRETDIKKPFSKNERFQILDAIEKSLEESRSRVINTRKCSMDP